MYICIHIYIERERDYTHNIHMNIRIYCIDTYSVRMYIYIYM